MTRNKPQRPSNGTYCCHIEGLPQDYTWQSLKDLARREAPHGLFADVQIFPYVTGRGYVRAQRRDDMESLFRLLINETIDGQYLLVSLWDVSHPSRRPQFLMSNHKMAFPGGALSQQVFLPTHNELWQAELQWPMINSMSPMYGGVPPVNFAPAGQFGYENYHGLAMLQQYATQPASMPIATSVAAGMGEVKPTPQTRSIFVSGLNAQTRDADVEDRFQVAGAIVHCEVHREGATGKSKGSATVKFSDPSEAALAVELFHGTQWHGMKIIARLDHEMAPAPRVAAPRPYATWQGPGHALDPLIVDGSGASCRLWK